MDRVRRPRLAALVEGALAGSLDLEGAAARVRAAAALVRQRRAVRLPLVDAVAGAGIAAGPEGGPDATAELGLAAAWEVDPFGALAAEDRAARLALAAAREDLADARLLVSAAVADAYFAAVEERLRLALLEEQVELDRTLLELTELRFAQGEASAVDVLQQRSQLAEARALVPAALSRLRAAENALDVLLGVPPDGRDRTAAAAGAGPGGFPALPAVPPVEVPASLLARRPDLRALRARVVAADHRVGAALAERLPRLVLGASASAVGGDGPDGLVRSALASLVQPVVDQGLRAAVVDERQAEREALLAAFGGAFLAAVREVEDLLYGERRQRERIVALEERADVLASNVREARFRYANGLTDYLPVLTAVSELQETERELVGARRELVDQRVALHVALGGPVPMGAARP